MDDGCWEKGEPCEPGSRQGSAGSFTDRPSDRRRSSQGRKHRTPVGTAQPGGSSNYQTAGQHQPVSAWVARRQLARPSAPHFTGTAGPSVPTGPTSEPESVDAESENQEAEPVIVVEESPSRMCFYCSGTMRLTRATDRPKVSEILEMPREWFRDARAGAIITPGEKVKDIAGKITRGRGPPGDVG